MNHEISLEFSKTMIYYLTRLYKPPIVAFRKQDFFTNHHFQYLINTKS